MRSSNLQALETWREVKPAISVHAPPHERHVQSAARKQRLSDSCRLMHMCHTRAVASITVGQAGVAIAAGTAAIDANNTENDNKDRAKFLQGFHQQQDQKMIYKWHLTKSFGCMSPVRPRGPPWVAEGIAHPRGEALSYLLLWEEYTNLTIKANHRAQQPLIRES